MVGSDPHQTSPHQAESANVCQQDEFLNLKRERDRRLANWTTASKDLKCEQAEKHT